VCDLKNTKVKEILILVSIIIAIILFVFVVGYIISYFDPKHSITGYSIAHWSICNVWWCLFRCKDIRRKCEQLVKERKYD